jgi:hypothetical protein
VTTYPHLLGEFSKQAALQKAREGIYSGRPLNGYYKDRWEELHQVDESKRKLIQQIFFYVLGGDYSLRILALECSRIGLTNYSGGPMSFKSVWNMLTNPFYAGFIRTEEGILVGRHEALVSEEAFERVQRILGVRFKSRNSPLTE